MPGLRPAQTLIGALVAAIALAPLLPRPVTSPPPRPAVTHSATSPAPLPASTVNLAGTLTLLVGDISNTHPVHPGDTLWDIARTWLGDPHRWTEIYRLNAGHHFPTGGTLTDPDLIYPGWTLRLPDDARPHDARAHNTSRHDASAPKEQRPKESPPRTRSASPPTSPDPSPAAPSPSTPSAPSEPSVTSEPPAPLAPSKNPDHPDTTDPTGVDIPGGWISLAFATALITASAAAVLRRRRRLRHDTGTGTGSRPATRLDARTDAELDPGTGTAAGKGPDNDDVAPLPPSVIAARREVRRRAPQRLRPTPDLTVRQAAQARQEDKSLPPPPDPGPSGPALAGLPSPTPSGGLGLTGPGAADAARALLIATLTAGSPQDGDAQGHVVIPTSTWHRLLTRPTAQDPEPDTGPSPDAALLTGLTVAEDLATALTQVEAELIARRRLLLDADAADLTAYRGDPDHEPLPTLTLITEPPAPDQTDRLTATAGLGATLGVTVVVLGPSPLGTTLTVSTDGHQTENHQAEGNSTEHRQDGEPPSRGPAPRIAVLDVQATLDILRTLARPHPPGASAAETPATVKTVTTVEDPKPTPPTPTSVPVPAPPPADASTARVLGSPAILMPDGTPVDSIREAALELLTYLAVHRDGASLDAIKEALYPDATRERARQRLSTDVANLRGRLRHALGDPDSDDPVVNTGGRYHLNPRLVDIDWWRVQDAVSQVKEAADDAAKTAAAEMALGHFHGPLADDRDFEWSARAQEHTRRLGVSLHARLAGLVADADPRRAAVLLDAACDLDPFDENLARHALRAHADTGDVNAVKTRMRRLRAALDELDESPDEQTEHLVRALLAHTTAPHPRPRPIATPRPESQPADPTRPSRAAHPATQTTSARRGASPSEGTG